MYPKEKCALFKPNEETDKRCHVYQRRVVLTASSGESLIWSNAVRFVIDVGVERRKVVVIKRVQETWAGNCQGSVSWSLTIFLTRK